MATCPIHSLDRICDLAQTLAPLLEDAADAGARKSRGAAIAEGNADDERLGEIAVRNGVEVIGPVPEGYL